jgi:hypothetical protein
MIISSALLGQRLLLLFLEGFNTIRSSFCHSLSRERRKGEEKV